MKRLIFFIIALLFFFFPTSVLADEGWIIENFNSDITIQKNGTVDVIETIEVDFNTLSKHGIYRDIPYVYEAKGKQTYTEIDIKSVKQNFSDAEYETTKTGGFVRLKIGDPDKTITSKNQYTIVYEVKGVLRGFPEHDEFYWNVTGNNWPIVIQKASVTVRSPFADTTQITCYEGYIGLTAECMIVSESPREAKFTTYNPLNEGQGLTAVVGYKKNLIPLLTVERPKTFWEKFTDWPSLASLATLFAFGIGTVVYLWYKTGRDLWYGSVLFGTKGYQGSIKPIGAHETTVVEYTPPENLRPAELGVLMDERAHTHDVVATIVDLAGRGFLTITEVPKKWLFGKTDYILNKKDKSDSQLLGYEKMLLDELFKTGNEIKVSSLKKTFYDELKKIKDELYSEVVKKGLFPSDPEKIRGKYFAIGFVLAFIGVSLIGYTISTGIVYLTDLCFGLLVSGIVCMLFSRHMPRRTAYGREMYRRTKGYRLFIEKAETHRQKFFEKKNLFNEVLPYTIVFGLTDKFAKAMDEIGLKATSPTWYSGTHHFNTHTFGASMNDFSSSLSSAMASTPSNSGGFSGGSSGGGFGGGGGGSW